MEDLTGFQRDILYVTASLGTPRGVDIKVELDDYYEADVFFGRLYPNLDTLATMGLIEKGKKDDRTNEYRLTERGRREIEARREWEDAIVGSLLETAAV